MIFLTGRNDAQNPCYQGKIQGAFRRCRALLQESLLFADTYGNKPTYGWSPNRDLPLTEQGFL
jgi:hypothetical protein